MRELKGQIFTKEDKFMPGLLRFEEGIIKEIIPLSLNELTAEEQKRRIIPGLIDIHMHGANGIDVCKTCLASDFMPGLEKLIAFEKSQGVTSFFPTTMTLPAEDLKRICENLAKAAKQNKALKGIYLEGPFIAPEKCGAQNRDHIVEPNMQLLQELDEKAQGLIRFVAFAPEVKNGLSFAKEASKLKTLCLGHSTADYETASEAFMAGAKQVTHLYNAMNCGSPREPGIPSAAADFENIKVELIADGIHLHPSTVRNAFKLYGDNVILISDSTEATGMSDGQYMLGDNPIYKSGRAARLENGTIAGSASGLFDCLKSCLEMGIKTEKVIVAASKNPAMAAGIFDRVGSLEPGKAADILVLNDRFEIEEVICNE